MGTIIDTCVWVDHLRARTPAATRKIADAAILSAEALLCEPVRFELLCGASRRERPLLEQRLETMPLLATPSQLWSAAGDLAAKARDAGLQISSLDFLIAALCIHHSATLTTFDAHFQALAAHSPLRVHLLTRPVE